MGLIYLKTNMLIQVTQKKNLWLTWIFEQNFRTNIIIIIIVILIFVEGRKYVFSLGHPTYGL